MLRDERAADTAAAATKRAIDAVKPLRGIGSDEYAKRAARVINSHRPALDGAATVSHAQLGSLTLGIDADASDLHMERPLVEPHKTYFIPSSSCIVGASAVLDEDGKPIVWPWQAGERRAASVVGGTSRPVREWHPLDALVNKGLDHASADGKRGRKHTGVRAWHAFCQDEMGTQADRPIDPNAPLHVKLEEEWLAMRFVCALVEERGVAVETARVYFSATQGWHAREHGVKLAGGLKLERLPQMLKGLKRVYGSAPRAVRRGIAPQALRRAMDMCLDRGDPAHANIRAALATALQGLLRGAEFTGVGRHMLTRGDVTHITREQMVIMMHPCKNMHHIGGKTCPLVIGGGGAFIDAVDEVLNMLAVDPHRASEAETTPLFRVPSTNEPISYRCVLDTTKQLMRAVGENPDHFGVHSYRIGGATALFTAGAKETVIRTMGRWSSDMHRLYVRACYEQCINWTKRAGSATVSDLAGDFDEVDYY